ncbi:MAG: SurA N-terminal domain-containing protein [Chitinophagales bacterium]|nr:SurA N-terminal domain-containing protein [Chitinophagales bacterium]
MGVIITIRNKFGYAIVGLIALAIVGFLIMDVTNSQTGIFGARSINAGTINGEEIALMDFQTKVNEREEAARMQMQGQVISPDMRFGIIDETWNNLIKEKLLGQECEKLGIKVTGMELYDMVQGPNPSPYVVQAFGGPQQFDRTVVAKYIANLDQDDKDGMTGVEKHRRWAEFENSLKEERLDNKYYSLIRKALTIPDWEAKKLYELQQASVDIDFVYLPYVTIPDNQVKLTDSDYEAFIQKHKKRFELEPSRVLDYVVFELRPSKADTLKAQNYINEQFENFKTAKNDSIFIKRNSEVELDTRYLKKEELISAIKDTFFRIDTGTFVGPYFDNGSFVVAKLLDRKLIPDSVEARSILITVNSQAEIEPKRTWADSIAKLIDEGKADFMQYLDSSKDQMAKMTGGSMGWVKPGTQFQTIDNALFYQYKEGDAFMVPSDRGFNIVQITNAKPTQPGVKVAFLSKRIVPSGETKDALFAQANQFRSKVLGKNFKETAKGNTIYSSGDLLPGSYTISSLGQARELVKWAFTAKQGEVSKVFRFNDKYVVAGLSQVKDRGLASVENVKTEIEAEVRNEKKAEMLLKKIEGAKDLQTVASKAGRSVQSVQQLSFNNNMIEGAVEPKVPSAAMGLKPGEVSKPIIGKTGVYVVQLKNLTPGPAIENMDMVKQQLSFSTQQKVQSEVLPALKKQAMIEDLRYQYDNF